VARGNVTREKGERTEVGSKIFVGRRGTFRKGMRVK